MDKLDSSCPMVGPAPVEKERSARHSQGSIYIIFSWINKAISDGGITVDFSIIKVHTSN